MSSATSTSVSGDISTVNNIGDGGNSQLILVGAALIALVLLVVLSRKK